MARHPENMAILALYDEAVQGEHGGAHNPAGRNQHSEAIEVNFDNVQVDQQKPENLEAAPTGNSAQAGIRRLRKAAEAGDEKAADLLARIGKAILCRQWRHYLGRQGCG